MLTNMKIGTRIILALLLPIIGLLFYSGNVLLDKRQQSNDMAKLNALAELALPIGEVVQNLQTERGFSAVYINTKGKKFGAELAAQRSTTDAQYAKLRDDVKTFNVDAYSGTLKTKLATAMAVMGNLNNTRNRVTAFSANASQMASFYTPAIRKFLDIIEEMELLSSNEKITASIKSYTVISELQESLGQERAVGAIGLSAGKFTNEVSRRFVGLNAAQDVYREIFFASAPPKEKALMKVSMTSKTSQSVGKMREIIMNSPSTGTLEGLTAPQWFRAVTAEIALLKKVKDDIGSDLITQVKTIENGVDTVFYIFLLITIVVLAVTAAAVTVIVRSITRPINELTDVMGVLAAGDTTAAISGTDRGDEIGAMGKAVEVFKVNMIQNNEMTEKQAHENKIKEQRRIAMEKTANAFEKDVTNVLNAVAKASEVMRSTAQGMAATAEETANQSCTVAAAAEEASTNVQTVASAAEELASSITEISRQVSQSTQIANTAVTEVDGANEKIQSLVEAAKKIGEVVALITDIADQTNLLALNATIEAARAGDAGKGFAVVASEVKNLANQTAKATEDISAQISGIQGATQDAVSAIDSIGGTINQMSEISSTIAAAVEEQGAATQEIARNVEQAASGTNEVTSNIAGVNQAATDTGVAAEQVLAAAGTLTKESDSMNTQVQTFLKDIKTA